MWSVYIIRKTTMSKLYGYIAIICVCFSLQVTAPISSAVEITKFNAMEAIEIMGAKGVIASPDLSSSLLKQCSRSAPDPQKVSGYWTPDRQQLETLERHLPGYLKNREFTIKDLSKYRRIYAGIVYENRKIIYVDFAHLRYFEPDWTKVISRMFCDGGDHFFGVEYDVKSQNFSHLSINGIA